jgi:hypothetical protein
LDEINDLIKKQKSTNIYSFSNALYKLVFEYINPKNLENINLIRLNLSDDNFEANRLKKFVAANSGQNVESLVLFDLYKKVYTPETLKRRDRVVPES